MEQLTLFTEEYGYSPDPGHAPDMPFAQLAELYFTHYAEQNLKASTKANYRYMADRFLLPAFGALPLSAFNNLMLTRWFAELPVSPAYCKNIFTVLRSMFTVAIHHGFIPTHPCDYVVLPRRPVDAEERAPRLTEAQAKELFDMTEEFSWFTSVVRFLLLTGARSGEAFGLRWQDVDFDHHVLHIRRNLVNVKGQHWLDTPKTKGSIRQLCMSPEIEKRLRRQKREQEIWMIHCGCDDPSGAEAGSSGKQSPAPATPDATSSRGTRSAAFPHPEMVFTTPKGNFIDHNYTARKFKQFVAGTSFSAITLHSLRHANATLMLAAGVDLKVVAALLGHSSIATTANLYTEVLDSTKAEAAMKVLQQLSSD